MKLHLLQLGLLQPPAIPIPGYAIQTDDGMNDDPPGPQGPLNLQLEMPSSIRRSDVENTLKSRFYIDPDWARRPGW